MQISLFSKAISWVRKNLHSALYWNNIPSFPWCQNYTMIAPKSYKIRSESDG